MAKDVQRSQNANPRLAKPTAGFMGGFCKSKGESRKSGRADLPYTHDMD